MRFYTHQHQYYLPAWQQTGQAGGIDLHTKNMYICILSQAEEILVHTNLKPSPDVLLRILTPYLPDIVVALNACSTGTGSPISAKVLIYLLFELVIIIL
jgi:hypothetical protein